MLLFTENVKSVSVYLLREAKNCRPSLLYQLHKKITEKGPIENSFRETVFSFVNNYSGNSAPLDTTSVVELESKLSEKGKQYLQIDDVHSVTLETWIVTMSAGRGRTLKLCLEDFGMKSGLLPCGGVAWNANVNTGGGVFCFLPLSVPQSGLPICINGSFAVSADRRSLCRKPESGTSDFKTNWNESLLDDVIVSAYVTLLHQTMAKENAKKYSDSFILWPNPLKISKNSDYGAVMTGFYKAIVCGINGETPPTIFMKEDGMYSIDDIVFTVHEIQNDNKMFQIVERVFQKITSKEVIRLPTWVRTGFEEAGYSANISNMTYSWERFFKDVFLPYLTDIEHEDVISLVSHALAEHDNTVLDLLKVSECIPSKTSHGRIYKKPSSLHDPYRFKYIFFEEEGAFPEDQFLEALDMRQKGTLKEIGCLRDDLSWENVLKRTKTVQCLWRTDIHRARQRVKALLDFMDNKLEDAGHGHQNVVNDLRKVKFLPAVLDGDVHLESPSNIYLAEERNLVGFIRHILDTSNTQGTLSQSVCRLLGLHGKKVKAIDVIKNLCRLKERNGKDFDSNSLHKQCESIYVYLQQHLEDEDVLHFLRNETVFCLHQEFIETKKLAFFSDSFPPYLFQIPGDWRHKFHHVLKAAGVKDFFGCNDFIRTLNLIKEEKNGEPLDQEMLSSILTKVIIPLCKIANNIPSEQISQIPLPDSLHILQPSGSLSYCDLDAFQHLTSKYKLCHREISSLHAKKLGVRDIRDQMLTNYSQNLPGYGGIGESFGQNEDLVTRITRIMEAYPCDFSILKELVQNADDANATKVHFVLDKREHPTNRLFYDPMKELQGPALLAYNNRPFTDDDITGIQRLGEGSKSDESDKTGRYGVGFNVVYHLTDCPMFLSGGNTLCIFDPTLQYVTDAHLFYPGRMFRPIDRTMLDSYCDLFNCFFSFENDFKLEEGTLFRFPLRQKNSQIGGKISPSHIENLLEDFKDEMFDMLLFLKNVTEISFSTCTNGNLDTTYTVTANLPQEQANERQFFFERMTQQEQSTLLEIPVSDLQYEISIKDNDGRLEEWLVHQRVGIANKDKIPESVKHANTVTKLKLFPKGGIAAMVTSKNSGRKVTNKNGKAFCFLPLPIDTNLPVHVDGYFALGHESRRNLWKAPVGNPKGDWNRLIAKEIIAPVYVLILKKIKADITDSATMGIKLCELKVRLHHYHLLFPHDFKASTLTSLNAWDELGKEFYQIVLQEKCTLFPVVHFERRTPGQTCQVGSNRTNVCLSWKSCVVNADNEGYFDDLHLQIPKQETEREKEKEEPKFQQLRHLLLNIGFPLLETPIKIYNTMQKIILSLEYETSIVLKINPQSVESWLKTVAKTTTLQGLPLHLKETRISSKPHLQLLVEYVTKATHLDLCGLPLLLTNDGVLREFSKSRKVFHSWYYILFPQCAAEFLHSQFLPMFKEKDECFVRLELSDLVDRLPTHLPKDRFCTGEYTQWHQDPHTKCRTPRADWVKKLWKFLYENRMKPDWEACVVHALGKWSILPVHGENEDVKYLVPLNLAKTVLSPNKSPYHKEMEKILKCLHCRMVDTTALNDKHSFSIYCCNLEEFCQFVMSFASNLGDAENTLLVFDRIMKCKFCRFAMLGVEEHRHILSYFSKQASLLAENSRNLEILKSLQCFETIHGDFVALTGKKIYTVEVENFPKCDQDIWLLRSGSVFLKRFSYLAEFLKLLSVEDLSDVELYKQFILPCFGQFSVAAQWEHLGRIIDMIRTNLNPDKIIRILDLKSMHVVPQENGNPRLASSFCDKENPVFKEMLDETCFPPKHPDQEYQSHWLQFLRQIGLQTTVSYVQFEDFARKLSKDARYPEREKILLSYFFENHHLHKDRNFLSRLANVPFISAADTPTNLRELHTPCSMEKVDLSAIPEKHQTLVWTKEAVLPKWVHFQNCQACKQEGKLKTVLPKTEEPTLSQVLSHTQTLCRSFAESHNTLPPTKGRHLEEKYELLTLVIRDILKFLSEKCERAQLCESCFDINKCCGSCGQTVKALEDVPLVPLKSRELFKAKRLTKYLPKVENENLFTFLRQLPTMFVPYCNLLYCLGTTEEPSLFQYASTLKLIKQQSYSDLKKNPNILRAAKQAIEGFFRCLDKEEETHLNDIDELILLTHSIETPLLASTQVYYNDEPSYAPRLNYFQHPLMRTVDVSAFSKSGLTKLVEKLGHLKPQLISLNVEEMQTSTAEETCGNAYKCPLSQQLKNVFSWRTFFPALNMILANEDVEEDDTELDKVLEANFNVKCLTEITTELRMKDGTVIPQSEADAGVLFKRTETQDVEVFISHSANDALVHHQIAEGFNNLFGKFLKSTQYLEVVFKSNFEEDVISNLCRRGLKIKAELEELIKKPILGSKIEEDIICLLIQDPFCHFSPTEYVGYNDTNGADEHLVYAKIIRKVDDDTCKNSENEYIKAKYMIEVSSKEQIEVDAIFLYKFMPPTDDSSMPEDEKNNLYNPNAPSSSSTDVVVFEGNSSQQDFSDNSDDFKDLDTTNRELSKIIEDVWKQDESFRRTALRRLLRKWHPDKHKEKHKKFAEEVFKHIRKEIERMEKGIPSGVDTDDDVFRWAQRNTAEQRQHWRFHQRRNGSRRRRGGRGSRGKWHTSGSTGFSTQGSTGFSPPPSFHKVNLDASRWLQQARIDIKAAAQFDDNHQDFFQWKCSLCFFAAEKSIRAAQLVCGCRIRNNQNIMDAALKLKRHLSVTSSVQELVQIVEKDSHYPSSCPDTQIPRDVFTKENADEAMKIAQNIMTTVHNYIQDG
ncbi:Sacsin [Holothuria leucospilota]|uniref:Sacsin n=1 Tax=Holothuria leucospilota TaxID=206669 RepID=A0A9Q1HBB9_HOLLE|nr:Sacsin [Holothuria leucospilota]